MWKFCARRGPGNSHCITFGAGARLDFDRTASVRYVTTQRTHLQSECKFLKRWKWPKLPARTATAVGRGPWQTDRHTCKSVRDDLCAVTCAPPQWRAGVWTTTAAYSAPNVSTAASIATKARARTRRWRGITGPNARSIRCLAGTHTVTRGASREPTSCRTWRTSSWNWWDREWTFLF